MDNVNKTPKQALLIGGYLLFMILSLIFVFFLMFPDIDLDNSVDDMKNFTLQGIGDTAQSLRIEFRPDLTASLSDTLEVKLQMLDSLGRKISSIPEVTHIIPAETVPNKTLFWLIIIIGALGASLHGLTSLTEYIGNRSFEHSWTMWYLMRPFAGAILALIFYFAGRAGLFGVVDTQDEFYGVLALAGLIGLFSKQALYKLSDIFDVLFQSKKETSLKDKMQPGGGSPTAPTISGVLPAEVSQGVDNQTIRVTGQQFSGEAEVTVNNQVVPTTFVSESELQAALDAASVGTIGTVQVAVRNPDPDGGVSESYELTVVPAPVPEQPAEEEPDEED